MEEKSYYQRKYYNKDLCKEIFYCYNYSRLRRGTFSKLLVYGISDGYAEVRSYLLTIMVGLISIIGILIPVSILITFVKDTMGISAENMFYDAISFLAGCFFLFLVYAIIMPRMIDLKLFRILMDRVLLGRLKKRIGD